MRCCNGCTRRVSAVSRNVCSRAGILCQKTLDRRDAELPRANTEKRLNRYCGLPAACASIVSCAGNFCALNLNVIESFERVVRVRAGSAIFGVSLMAALTASSALAQLLIRAPDTVQAGTDLPGTAGVNGVRGAAWKLLTGYQFSQSFGLEAAYGDLGRYGYASGVPGLSAAGDVRMRAWSLAGTGYLPLGLNWSLTGKIGLGSRLAELSRVAGPFPASPWPGPPGAGRSDFMLGLGLGYSLGRGFGLRFAYENFGVGAAAAPVKSDQWAVSLKYSF